MSDLDNTFGDQSVSQQQREQKIRRVFKVVAPRYDLMNDFMSFGIHRFWKTYFVKQIKFKKTDTIVDLAGGTGDIAKRLVSNGANVIVVDPSVEMISEGLSKGLHEGRESGQALYGNVAAIGEKLPFADASIDIVTISFGIRNMTSMSEALQEIYRVLKPGGQFYCLEFSKAKMPIRPFYNLHNKYIIPRLGALVSGQEEAYQYLIESIKRFPSQEEMKSLIAEAGFKEVTYNNLFFGIACIHHGVK